MVFPLSLVPNTDLRKVVFFKFLLTFEIFNILFVKPFIVFIFKCWYVGMILQLVVIFKGLKFKAKTLGVGDSIKINHVDVDSFIQTKGPRGPRFESRTRRFFAYLIVIRELPLRPHDRVDELIACA